MTTAGSAAAGAPRLLVAVPRDVVHVLKVYVSASPQDLDAAETPLRFIVEERGGGESAIYDAMFARP